MSYKGGTVAPPPTYIGFSAGSALDARSPNQDGTRRSLRSSGSDAGSPDPPLVARYDTPPGQGAGSAGPPLVGRCDTPIKQQAENQKEQKEPRAIRLARMRATGFDRFDSES